MCAMASSVLTVGCFKKHPRTNHGGRSVDEPENENQTAESKVRGSLLEADPWAGADALIGVSGFQCDWNITY